MSMNPLHILVDFIVADHRLLATPQPGIAYLREAVLAGGVTILSEHVHQFEPEGYSGIFLLAQSHASIHTWIENDLISIDVFACGPIDVNAIIETLRERFQPKSERIERRARGVVPHMTFAPSPPLPQ